MPGFITLMILFFLAFQVMIITMGLNRNPISTRLIVFLFVPVLMQSIAFWLGWKLGASFLYTLIDFKNIVIFIGFFLIGLRFVTDAFIIRKGKKSIQTTQFIQVALLSIAQSVNTFLAGLLFYFFTIKSGEIMVMLALLSLVFSFSGWLFQSNKKSLSFISMMMVAGGLFLICASVYFVFYF